MKAIKFVDVGEGITEGHIQKWLVNDGDAVKEDQSLLQVETDKAVVNVPSPIDGFVKIVAKENTIVHVGDMIAQIGTREELSSQQATQVTVQKQVQQPMQAPEPQAAAQHIAAAPNDDTASETQKEIIATPYVRKLARDMNVDLSKIKGTGPNGRVLENDVKNASYGAVASKVAAAGTGASHAEASPQSAGGTERIPMSQTRKAIARNMELSWTIPRAVHMDLINASSLFKLVSREKQILAKDMNVHLTFLPFIIKATVEAIKENPNFNASYDKEKQEIVRKNYYNIGLAAEAPDGLKVAVIKDADKKTIIQLANEISELAEKVRNQTITLQEMQDSTFTITNIGSLGGGYLSVPMINYPNVAILGIQMIRDTPIVDEGMVKVGKQLPFSLVFDHRVVDGAEAVKFGNALIKYLEDPDLLEML
ncbi:MAG: dihydrolipoamide acetyltransferase family protein [Candidatus Micrarchaeaceae archaeon]